MNQRPQIPKIEDFPGYFGLKIEYRDDLPDNNAGFLDPDDEPQYIAINRNLPHCEQAFTIAHELGHYVKHHNRPPLKYFPCILDRQYKSKRVNYVASHTNRFVHYKYGKEWQADLYALVFLITIGATKDLTEYLERHPHQRKWFFLSLLVIIVKDFPRIIKNLFLRFLNLFRPRPA
jgi:hypothetical protein